MTTLTFYEKPGCISHKKQKRLLEAAGVSLEVKDLLQQPWRKEELASFFTGLMPKNWVNQNAPQIKSGQLKPEQLTTDQLLDAMLQDPLLIRRPLLEWQSLRWCGFNASQIAEILPIEANIELADNLEHCSRPSEE